MSELKLRIGELAQIMEEFGLEEAKLAGDDWMIEFSRTAESNELVHVSSLPPEDAEPRPRSARAAGPSLAPAPIGTPVSSPMTGIYYSSPSPGAPPFVKDGDHVTAGQVVGLIEAMKVFNEITATVSGNVIKIVAENGQLVNPGDPLLFVG